MVVAKRQGELNERHFHEEMVDREVAAAMRGEDLDIDDDERTGRFDRTPEPTKVG